MTAPRTALAAALALGVALAAAGAPLEWRLGPYARRDGDLLTVDVPAGADGGAARATVDLSRLGAGVECRVRARGENVSANPVKWLGSKFMLSYDDASGRRRYPGAPQRAGTFDWQTFKLRHEFDGGLADGKGELTLGLQSATGKIVFDLSTLEVKPAEPLWKVPPEDAGYRCEYSPALRSAPPARGVMLPSRDCREDDFRTLKEWGATLARYQMTRNWHREGDNRDKAEFRRWLDERLDHLDRVVLPLAVKYGVGVVVDLHVAPGGRTDSELNMFYEREYADEFVDIWRGIARRFRGRAGIRGYDLINEPNQCFAALPDGDYWQLQRRAAEAIREVDPATPVVVEANGWDAPAAFAYMRPLRMKDVVYQVHLYRPMEFTHQGVGGNPSGFRYPDPARGWDRDYLRKCLAPVREFQLRHGARIYVGEFSAAAWAEGADAYLRDAISIFEEYGWDWSYHAFREWAGWSVEHEGEDAARLRPAADTPRKRALLDGFRRPRFSLPPAPGL